MYCTNASLQDNLDQSTGNCRPLLAYETMDSQLVCNVRRGVTVRVTKHNRRVVATITYKDTRHTEISNLSHCTQYPSQSNFFAVQWINSSQKSSTINYLILITFQPLGLLNDQFTEKSGVVVTKGWSGGDQSVEWWWPKSGVVVTKAQNTIRESTLWFK